MIDNESFGIPGQESRMQQAQRTALSPGVRFGADGRFHYPVMEKSFRPSTADYNALQEVIILEGTSLYADPSLLITEKEWGDILQTTVRNNALRAQKEFLADVQLSCPSCGSGFEGDNIMVCRHCRTATRWVTGNPLDTISSLQRQIYLLADQQATLSVRTTFNPMTNSDERIMQEDIEELLHKKSELLMLEIKATKKDRGESVVKGESFHCPGCGGGLENPYQCEYCTSSIVHTDVSLGDMLALADPELDRIIQDNQALLLAAAKQLRHLDPQVEMYGGVDFSPIKQLTQQLRWRHAFDKSRIMLANAQLVKHAMGNGQRLQEKLQTTSLKNGQATPVEIINSTLLISRCHSCAAGTETMSAEKGREVLNPCSCSYCGATQEYGNSINTRTFLETHIKGTTDRHTAMVRKLQTLWHDFQHYYDGDFAAYIQKGDKNALVFQTLIARYPRFIEQANRMLTDAQTRYNIVTAQLPFDMNIAGVPSGIDQQVQSHFGTQREARLSQRENTFPHLLNILSFSA